MEHAEAIPGANSQAAAVDALNAQGDLLRRPAPDQAQRCYQEAQARAQSGVFADQPYTSGLAASLVGQAEVSLILMEPEAVAQNCLQALAYLDEDQPSKTSVEAYLTLSWLNQFVGDYSTALDWGHKAHAGSLRLGLAEQEARALDAVATVQGLLRDFSAAVATHRQALQIVRAIPDDDTEVTVTNNYAMTLLDQGEYAAALAIAQHSLELAQRSSWATATENALDTVGQILMAMGDYAQAESLFQQALVKAAPVKNRLYQTYLLKNLGRVALAQGELDCAALEIGEALTLALQSELRQEQADCHELLAEIAEQTGDLGHALAHFRQFHAIHEEIAGERAAKHLALINVMHEVEKAKRDAEIQRLRNLELQAEIEERREFQTTLEKLAQTDALTGLHNRGHFFALAEQEFSLAAGRARPLAVLMLDLDHFKRINDTYGHAVGDQVLAEVAARLQAGLRGGDLLGRIGGEEFAALLPRTHLTEGVAIAARLCQQVSETPVPTTAGPVAVTLSVGIAERLSAAVPAGSFDHLLQQADQALYQAKDGGRNRVEIGAA